MPAGQTLPELVVASATTQWLFSAVKPPLQEHWPCWQSALAGQAYPHPPQLAGSLLILSVQVPVACVPAAPGWVVPAGAASSGEGVATAVSPGVISAGGAVVPGKRVQPAVSIITMTTAHRYKR